MSALPPPLAELITELGRLPGIGPRSSERLALHLVQCDPVAVKQLAQTLLAARERIQFCQVCGALTEQQPCQVCSDPRRDRSVICVVERAVDIFSLEKPAVYRGLYHVLGGRLSPVNGIGPEDLRIAELEQRLKDPQIQEIILALGSDVEGDATSYYLAQQFAAARVKVTRLAHGLPVGGSLEFADELTLGQAIQGRQSISS